MPIARREFDMKHRILIVFLSIIFLQFTSAVIAENSEARYQELLDSVNANDLDTFQKLLGAGQDPNYIGKLEHFRRNWVMCSITDLEKDGFLKLALESGGNPNVLHPELAHRPGGAIASNPLVCAIGAGNLRAVKVLYAAGANLDLPVCQLCDPGRDNRGLVELATAFNQYNIVYWLMTETESTSNEQLQRVATIIEFTNLSKSVPQYPSFLKTIEHLKSLGFDIEREG